MLQHFQRSTLAFLSTVTVVCSLMPTALALRPEEIYRRASSAVVLVVAGNQTVGSLGSGFVIHPKGLIVTDDHVISQYRQIYIKTADGAVYPATVVSRNAKLDLALVRIQPRTALPSLKLRTIPPQIGQRIYTIGNPLGMEKSISDGIVSRLEDDGYVQYTAATNPGNSGGPLLNEDAEVIGVVRSVQRNSTGINFAIPASTLSNFLTQKQGQSVADRQGADALQAGTVQIMKGNYQQAIAIFDRAIATAPTNASLYTNRGAARLGLKDYQGAVRDFNQSIGLRPTSIAYYARAKAKLGLRDRVSALADTSQAISLNREWGGSSLADALRLRGSIHQSQNNVKLAIADLQRAAEQYDRQGKAEQSQQVINQILRLKTRIE